MEFKTSEQWRKHFSKLSKMSKPPMKKEKKCNCLCHAKVRLGFPKGMPCIDCFYLKNPCMIVPSPKVESKKAISKENYELGVLSNREEDFPSPPSESKECECEFYHNNIHRMDCPEYTPKPQPTKECLCGWSGHKDESYSPVRISKLEDKVIDFMVLKQNQSPLVLAKINEIIRWINSQK